MKDKIRDWKLKKKHKSREMLTALYMLMNEGYDGQNRPSGEMNFSIRGRLVPFDEVIRYWRRRNIDNPVRHFRA